MPNSIDVYRGIFLHVIPVRIIVPWQQKTEKDNNISQLEHLCYIKSDNKRHRHPSKQYSHPDSSKPNTHSQPFENRNLSITCTRCGAKGHHVNEPPRSKEKICNKWNKKRYFPQICFTKLSTPNSKNFDWLSDHEVDIFKLSQQQQSYNISRNVTTINMIIDFGATISIIN